MLSKLKLKNIPHAHPHNINSLRPGIESPFQKNKKKQNNQDSDVQGRLLPIPRHLRKLYRSLELGIENI